MIMKINWKRLYEVKTHLSDNFNDEDPLTLIMILRNGTARKKVIKIKDLLPFFWKAYDSPKVSIVNLIIKDKLGQIAYRHKYITTGDEEIPVGGNPSLVANWNSFTKKKKDTLIKLLVAQITSYE